MHIGTFYCIDYFKNKNDQILGYRLISEEAYKNGIKYTPRDADTQVYTDISKSKLVELLKSNKIKVLNLSMTSENRILYTIPPKSTFKREEYTNRAIEFQSACEKYGRFIRSDDFKYGSDEQRLAAWGQRQKALLNNSNAYANSVEKLEVLKKYAPIFFHKLSKEEKDEKDRVEEIKWDAEFKWFINAMKADLVEDADNPYYRWINAQLNKYKSNTLKESRVQKIMAFAPELLEGSATVAKLSNIANIKFGILEQREEWHNTFARIEKKIKTRAGLEEVLGGMDWNWVLAQNEMEVNTQISNKKAMKIERLMWKVDKAVGGSL